MGTVSHCETVILTESNELCWASANCMNVIGRSSYTWRQYRLQTTETCVFLHEQSVHVICVWCRLLNSIYILTLSTAAGMVLDFIALYDIIPYVRQTWEWRLRIPASREWKNRSGNANPSTEPFHSRASSPPGAKVPIGPWPIHSLELLFPETLALRSEFARELSFSTVFAPRNFWVHAIDLWRLHWLYSMVGHG